MTNAVSEFDNNLFRSSDNARTTPSSPAERQGIYFLRDHGPRSFRDPLKNMVGHERQKEQILRAIRSGNIPHAYLFSGIEGIGKKLFAEEVAKVLLCTAQNENMSACNGCPSCIMMKEKEHPDLIEIVPKKDKVVIDIDSIRELKEALRFSPYQSKRRVIIIDNADIMTTASANAALKILEEPPPNNHFFIITWAPTKLLPTIISRCQKVEFSPLTNEQIRNFLISAKGYTSDQAQLSAEISEGSIGRAISLTPELIDQVIADLASILRSNSSQAILAIASKWANDENNIGNVLYILHKCFHSAVLAGSVQNSKGPNNSVFWRLSEQIMGKNSELKLLEKCGQINQTHDLVTMTYNKQLMFEQLLFTLAS